MPRHQLSSTTDHLKLNFSHSLHFINAAQVAATSTSDSVVTALQMFV